jgi:hypothetical protein
LDLCSPPPAAGRALPHPPSAVLLYSRRRPCSPTSLAPRPAASLSVLPSHHRRAHLGGAR